MTCRGRVAQRPGPSSRGRRRSLAAARDQAFRFRRRLRGRPTNAREGDSEAAPSRREKALRGRRELRRRCSIDRRGLFQGVSTNLHNVEVRSTQRAYASSYTGGIVELDSRVGQFARRGSLFWASRSTAAPLSSSAASSEGSGFCNRAVPRDSPRASTYVPALSRAPGPFAGPCCRNRRGRPASYARKREARRPRISTRARSRGPTWRPQPTAL